MGSWGAVIMGFFGAVFATMTLSCQFALSGAPLALPFLVFAAIALAAWQVERLPGSGIRPSEKVRKAIMWSSAGEGIGLFLITNLVMNTHHEAWLMPSIALVVGLHFIPIALAAAFRPFLLLGLGLIGAALLGVAVPPPLGGTLSGFLAAGGLWLASTMALLRDRAAKRLA